MYYLYNGHADVTALINSNGTVIASYYYDAFGEIVEQTGDYHNPYRYSGYHYDEESELYDLKARFYDAKLARFMQEDTYLGETQDPLSLNLYTYCYNNPMIFKDYNGHKPTTFYFEFTDYSGVTTGYYVFNPDSRWGNIGYAFLGIIPGMQSYHEKQLYKHTTEFIDTSAISKAMSAIGDAATIVGWVDTILDAGSTLGKTAGWLSNILLLGSIAYEAFSPNVIYNQIVYEIFKPYSTTRNGVISQYLLFYAFVEAAVDEGIITYTKTFSGNLDTYSYDEDAYTKFAQECNFDEKQIRDMFKLRGNQYASKLFNIIRIVLYHLFNRKF